MIAKIAIFLSYYGFEIISYGKGTIEVVYNDYNRVELAEICDKFELINNLREK